MDFRNEYRIAPTDYTTLVWALEFRNWWSPWKWRYITSCDTEEKALKLARIHAGVGTKSLGRLPKNGTDWGLLP